MTTLLQIDASPRPGRAGIHLHGSVPSADTPPCPHGAKHGQMTRHLSRRGRQPAAPVSVQWIAAAYGSGAHNAQE